MEATVQTGDPGGDVLGASAAKVMILEQPATAGASSAAAPCVRAVVQQCMSAQLMVQPSTPEDQPQFVEIQRGIIIYLCFLRGATKAHVEKLAKMIQGIRLSEGDSGKLTSVIDLPGDVMIIPQATLGGTPKGKVMQYHKNIAKDEGMRLYSEFVSIFQKTYERNDKCLSAGTIVRYGTYGNRQVFSCQTNGPFTHLMEI
ncbi:D-aminoacyl-tRNA deacylase 2-like [Littorina saxatilis]|uniref:D-aminoacyl-tRNA deacylase n=1 Tax=Littorina saxatilis TaxID=31220 RepID=A0AAN9BEQ9_9CAEN